MIAENRKKHIWAVAELMKKYGQERNMSKEDCEDLFMLGLLHDVGYEFAEPENYILHNKIGGGYFEKTGLQVVERSLFSRIGKFSIS